MSAILDALRKVERETAQRAQQPASLSDMPLARVLAEKRNRKVFRQLVIAITILFLVGTGATIMLGHKVFSFKGNVSSPKVAEGARKIKEPSPTPVPVRGEVEVRKPAIAVKKPAPEPEKLVKKERPISLPVAAKTLQKPAIEVPARSSSQIEPRRSEAPIPDLELQAIVWSADPKNCSAMINGRLVRSGEKVGGYTVDEIGQNYVSLKSGLRSGRLRMVGAR